MAVAQSQGIALASYNGAATDAADVYGIWGKVRPLTFSLREGDRIECYRALQADPKAARRARSERGMPPGEDSIYKRPIAKNKVKP